MRLIDIDKVVSDYKGKNKSLQNVTWFELTDYEVKAIPIEWIENQIKRTTDITDEKELDVLYAGNLGYMLKLWEKENEIN